MIHISHENDYASYLASWPSTDLGFVSRLFDRSEGVGSMAMSALLHLAPNSSVVLHGTSIGSTSAASDELSTVPPHEHLNLSRLEPTLQGQATAITLDRARSAKLSRQEQHHMGKRPQQLMAYLPKVGNECLFRLYQDLQRGKSELGGSLCVVTDSIL